MEYFYKLPFSHPCLFDETEEVVFEREFTFGGKITVYKVTLAKNNIFRHCMNLE